MTYLLVKSLIKSAYEWLYDILIFMGSSYCLLDGGYLEAMAGGILGYLGSIIFESSRMRSTMFANSGFLALLNLCTHSDSTNTKMFLYDRLL
jgi:hypothetical protein